MVVTILGGVFALVGVIVLLLTFATADKFDDPSAPSLGWPLGIGAVLVAFGGYLIFFT